MHQTGCFRNRDYGALVIFAGERVAHRALVLPPYFVFPFMSPDDLQIGYTATHVEYRGRGLATFAIREIIRRLSRPRRRFWYLTEESNTASVRAAKRAGLSLAAEGVRKDRLHVRAFGYFALTGVGAEHS
jgi:RimJ/RimL family protein N-acetyltransferase